MSIIQSLSNVLKIRRTQKYRIAVLGSKQVGKTSIISQFTGQVLAEEDTHYNTSRAVFKTQRTKFALDILDTSGFSACFAMLHVCISRSDAFIIVFSVDDKESFEKMQRMRQDIIEAKMNNDVPIVVVATRTDVPDEGRVVSREAAEHLVKEKWQHEYVEATSSKYEDACEVFRNVVKQLKPSLPLSPVLERRRRSAPGDHQRRRGSVLGFIQRLTKRNSV